MCRVKTAKHSSKKQPTASLEARTHQQFNAVEELNLHNTKYFYSVILWCLHKMSEQQILMYKINTQTDNSHIKILTVF